MTMQMQTDESIGASGSGGQHAAQRSLAVPVLVCTIHSFVPYVDASNLIYTFCLSSSSSSSFVGVV
jgi:hypothetical protein